MHLHREENTLNLHLRPVRIPFIIERVFQWISILYLISETKTIAFVTVTISTTSTGHITAFATALISKIKVILLSVIVRVLVTMTFLVRMSFLTSIQLRSVPFSVVETAPNDSLLIDFNCLPCFRNDHNSVGDSNNFD